jgi:hypothetical protein
MKIVNQPKFIPDMGTAQGTRRPEATEVFQTLLKQRCQQAGAPVAPESGPAILDLAGAALDLLERIAAQMAGAAPGRDMAAAHEQLARQASRLRQAAEGLGPGPLKDIVTGTAALSYLQLWRFEQGEFF